MKTGEMILLMLAGCVTLSILVTIFGIVLKGGETNEKNMALRTALIDLLKVISGAVIGAISTSQ